MTAVWKRSTSGWELVQAAGFDDEAALHELVRQTPQVLPLSGAPRLSIIGSEVRLGNSYADLIAIESSGRLAIIELKLAKNPEARRAVVAQTLAYAAHLHGLDKETLEREVLRDHLRSAGHETLVDLAAADDQEGAFDPEVFAEGLSESLSGRFRLVIVLDQAPEELIQVVGFLETVADRLTIDLVTVSTYDIDDSRVLVPQRVDPERRSVDRTPTTKRLHQRGRLVHGSGEFEAAIVEAPVEARQTLARLLEWARSLEAEGLVRLSTYHGTSGRKTLLPRFHGEDVGLATIWNDGGAFVTLYRSVFERLAPKGLETVEGIVAPRPVGQGNSISDITEELLDALKEAYREGTRARSAVD